MHLVMTQHYDVDIMLLSIYTSMSRHRSLTDVVYASNGHLPNWLVWRADGC